MTDPKNGPKSAWIFLIFSKGTLTVCWIPQNCRYTIVSLWRSIVMRSVNGVKGKTVLALVRIPPDSLTIFLSFLASLGEASADLFSDLLSDLVPESPWDLLSDLLFSLLEPVAISVIFWFCLDLNQSLMCVQRKAYQPSALVSLEFTLLFMSISYNSG